MKKKTFAIEKRVLTTDHDVHTCLAADRIRGRKLRNYRRRGAILSDEEVISRAKVCGDLNLTVR